MDNREKILRSTFESKGFTLNFALGAKEGVNISADPAFKRILCAMEKYKEADKITTYAILRPNEDEEAGECKHDTLYKFYYDTNENFFVIINGRAIEETSTAFNFLTVQP